MAAPYTTRTTPTELAGYLLNCRMVFMQDEILYDLEMVMTTSGQCQWTGFSTWAMCMTVKELTRYMEGRNASI